MKIQEEKTRVKDLGPAARQKRPKAQGSALKIVTVRRISQIFFLTLFFWFCITATVGTGFWQLRGWPINWFLELDPLTGLATLLATGKLYKGLAWGVLTLILTLVFGRFFCGWVCPFGTLHQVVGFLGKLGRPQARLTDMNRPSRWQSAKYYILFFFVASLVAGAALGSGTPLVVSLLDPIPFAHRFINLTLLPFADQAILHLSPVERFYDGAWIIGGFGIVLLLANLWLPRFFCRYLCPLGALFGLFSSISFWQIGKSSSPCRNCLKCQFHCEGACDPMGQIRLAECLLCMNCLDQCTQLTYQAAPSAGESPAGPGDPEARPRPGLGAPGQIRKPDLSRRGFVSALVSGATLIPMMHLSGATRTNFNPYLVRPPGSLPEDPFLARCVKCDQCIRVCPTNVIQPAGITEAGLPGLWTPVLNFRIGSSGCQLHCTACGNVCPTGAILPLELDQRTGSGRFEKAGAIKMGTAFVDLGRCLPWTMDTPCIVCQENCPVSPKAIRIKEAFVTLRTARITSLTLAADKKTLMVIDGQKMTEGEYGTGDYFVQNLKSKHRYPVLANSDRAITILSDVRPDGASALGPGGPEFDVHAEIRLSVRLQRPFIDPKTCIGCGVCEHECPVKGKPAIRVTAENESRNRDHVLIG